MVAFPSIIRVAWTLDGLGNWSAFDDNGSSETRDVNAANEIQTVNGDSTVTYDLAGNMTSDGTLDYQYDAWNRLVKVTAPEGWIDEYDNHVDSADYAYDGLGRRIEKAVHASGSGYLSPLDDYYYNQNWQMLEDLGGSLAVPRVSTTDYVWSPRYQDAPIVALHHSLLYQESDSACYYTTDANHNVTATIDGATGNVVNRYSYTAYGKATQYDASWSNAAAPTGDGPLYCGYFFDAETGNYQVEHRYYSVAIATWLTRDPIGYRGGMNVYAYCYDSPPTRNDPSGLAWVWPWDPNASWCPDDTIECWTGIPASSLPHGAGVVGSGAVEGGIVAGAGGTVEAGGGAFTGGNHVGGFAGGGGFVGGPNGPTAPASNSPHGAVGAFAGIGGGGFLTNASNVTQLRGPFHTCSLNVGIGPIKGSIQIGVSGGTWIGSITVGPGIGADISKYPTYTGTTP